MSNYYNTSHNEASAELQGGILRGILGSIDDDSYFTTYNAWFLFFLSISIFVFIVDICLHKICRDIAICLKE